MSSPTSRGPTTISTLSPLASGTFTRLRLTAPEEEDEAKAALPKAALSPRPRSAAGRRSRHPACAEDDIAREIPPPHRQRPEP